MAFTITHQTVGHSTDRLGRAAMWLSATAAAGSLIASIVVGFLLGPLEVKSAQGLTDTEHTLLILCFVLLASQLLWLGLGIWALIQGIVAVTTHRGRQYGVTAIAVAVGAPVISFMIFVGLTLLTSPLG